MAEEEESQQPKPPVEGVRALCYRSNYRHHHWRLVDKLTERKDGGTIIWHYHCILCQVIKMKILKYVEKTNHQFKAVCTEIFPSGQIVDEWEPSKPVSQEQEEYSAKPEK